MLPTKVGIMECKSRQEKKNWYANHCRFEVWWCTYADRDAILVGSGGKLYDEPGPSFFFGIVQRTETTDDFDAVFGGDLSLGCHCIGSRTRQNDISQRNNTQYHWLAAVCRDKVQTTVISTSDGSWVGDGHPHPRR